MKPNSTQSSALADTVVSSLREWSFALDPEVTRALDRADRWLCVRARPLWLRRLWRNLWVRLDEMHPAFSLDPELWAIENARGNASKMEAELCLRRSLAHHASLAA